MKKLIFLLICTIPVIATGWGDDHQKKWDGHQVKWDGRLGRQEVRIPSPIPAPPVIPAPAGTHSTPAPLAQRTAETLNLSECTIINLTLPQKVQQALTQNKELPPFTLTLPIRGVECTLELWPHSVRSPNYFEVKAQQADGSWVVHDPGPVRTVRGIMVDSNGVPLPGMPKVAGSVGVDGNRGNRGFRGLVLMPDMSEVWIEPLGDRVPGAKQNDYVVYEASAVKDRGFECGVEERHKGTKAQRHQTTSPLSGPVDDALYCAEIAYDVDFEMSDFYGHDSGIILASTEATTNLVNLQFEHQVHITHLITAVLIRTAEPDPYGPDTGLGSLWTQARSEWLTNQSHIPRDVVILFTGTQGFGLGFANIASVCDPNRAYSVVRGLGMTGNAVDVSVAKHELGHTWGAFHCSCPGHTMGSAQSNFGFSQESIDAIVAYRDSAPCLDICGIVEAGSIPIPFFDNFEGPVIDPTRWIGVDGAASVSDLGANEPSGYQSLRISGNSEIRSAFMNTVGPWGFEVRYWWQPGGSGTPPNSNDLLTIEYLAANFGWVPAGEHVGNSSSESSFQLFTTVLNIARSDMFRFRIRSISSTGGNGGGDWFVDDLELIPIHYNPCPEDCAPNFNGVVDGDDLFFVIAALNGQNLGGNCDVTPQFSDGSFGNGVVNIDDLVSILINWGPCE